VDVAAITPSELTERLAIELRALPARSATAVRVLHALEDPRSGPVEIAAVLESDAALAVRVLHMANSPFYGLSRRVGSLPQAVTVIGFTSVRSVAAATAVGLVGEETDPAAEELWRHSRQCASVVAVLLRRVTVGGHDAFGAALLHDVGASLLARIVPDELAAARNLAEDTGMSQVEAETAVLGLTHAEAGARALDELGLPDRLVRAVREHHTPAAGSMAAMVAAANEAAHWLERGAADDDAGAVTAALSHLGVPAEEHDAVLDEVRGEAEGPERLMTVLR
jgi:putative nucleotidyltransferase with HDIG domain